MTMLNTEKKNLSSAGHISPDLFAGPFVFVVVCYLFSCICMTMTINTGKVNFSSAGHGCPEFLAVPLSGVVPRIHQTQEGH